VRGRAALGGLILAFANLTSVDAEDAPVRLWGSLKPGPWAIGFRVVGARDASRRLSGTTTARPIQIGMWYPAMTRGAAAMTYGDYVRLAASERTLAPATPAQADEAVSAYSRFLAGTGAPPSAISLWLGASMAATRDAEPARGSFPLVVIAQGNGGAVPDQALLGEYLASHGYVVATSPSQARLGDTMTSEQDILPSARAQALDLAFIVRQLRSFPAASGGLIGLVGYSFGGRSALLMAAREPRVAALASLDSGIATKTGRGWLPRGDLDSTTFRVPILHIFEDADDFTAPDFTLLASLAKSDRHLVRVSDLSHFEFITYGMATAVVPGLNPEASRRRLDLKVAAIFAYTRAFLDAQIKQDSAARSFLARSPAQNGLPGEVLTLARMKPSR
jgi:dienelactone hydrolase